jgi:hypothetical protein
VGADPSALGTARALCRPAVLIFLDEPAWQASALDVVDVRPFAVPDPHRSGQAYEGWWGRAADGTVVGKSPQHPTMHRLYRAEDLEAWLQAIPRPRGSGVQR